VDKTTLFENTHCGVTQSTSVQEVGGRLIVSQETEGRYGYDSEPSNIVLATEAEEALLKTLQGRADERAHKAFHGS